MRAVSLISLVVISLWAGPLHAQNARPIDPIRLEAFVDGAVHQAMATDHIAGLSVAVVDGNGVVLAKGYGAAGQERSADASTTFRAGSISKTFVWIAITQLVVQGKLKLDDPINAHLPKALQIADEGFKEPIRIRNLLTHTEGFEDSALGSLFTRNAGALMSFDDYLVSHRVHRVRAPGLISVYSNYGASLAAAIVEHETAMRWEDYAEERILRPLGMAHATFREPYEKTMVARGFPAPLTSEDVARVSSGFSYVDASYKPQPWKYVMTPPIGALSVSANDMTFYMRALLDPRLLQRAGVLSAAAALEMRKPLFRDVPHFGAWLYGFYEMPAPDGEIAFGHDGDLIYQHALMMLCPTSGVGIFIAANTSGGAPFRWQLARGIVAKFLGNKSPPPLVRISEVQAQRYAGFYEPLRRSYFRSERAFYGTLASAVKATTEGDLLIAGNTLHRYRYIGHDTFEDSEDAMQIAFVENDGRMRLYSEIPGGPAERISFFATSNWLILTLSIMAITAFWRTLHGAWRLARARESWASLTLDGASLIWLAGSMLLILTVVPWLSDQSAAVYNYPGPLLPLACWLFAGAAAATVLAVVAIAIARPRNWTAWRWAGAIVTVVVFASATITMQSFGLLGFSGW